MKILLVNKFHYLKGGSEKYYFELANLLKEKGNEIAFFSMENEKNIHTEEKEYFVDNIDLNTASKFKAFDIIYSKKNAKKMEQVLDDFKPDIVHLNNFQRQLSASIIKPIKKRNIPIVFTAHDLQVICPAISMLDNEKNICEDCMNGKYINCIRKKCNKASSLKSFLGTIEAYYYKTKKIYTKKIDDIITPSKFYKEKFIKNGINENKIKIIHNFIDVNKYDIETTDEGYALYIGRLSKEKGITNLVKAFAKLKNRKLYIIGDGEEKENIKKIIKKENIGPRIKLFGHLMQDEVKDKISKCRFVVVPSIWYENCPYSILETLAIGKPVLGSKIGGIQELVIDNINGLTYDYNNEDEFLNKMQYLFENDNIVIELGKNAKEYAINNFNKEVYYKRIIEIYNNLLLRGVAK